MAALTTIVTLLGLDREKWERVGPTSVNSAAALVTIASFLLALNRFGGLAFAEPRSFVRLALAGVWGWVGIATITLMIVGRTKSPHGPSARISVMLAVAGLAHVPLIWLSIVLLLAGNALQLLLPGLVMAMFVFGFWFPAALIIGARVTCPTHPGRAVVGAVTAYAAWLSVIGKHLNAQLGHLV